MTRMYGIRLAVLVAALFPSSALAQTTFAQTNNWTFIACVLIKGCTLDSNGQCDCLHGPLQEAITIENPGSAGGSSPSGDLCADIYVFKSDQEMSECCGCKVTPDGVLTLGLRTNLVNNPLNGVIGTSGTIRIVSSATTGGSCDASKPNPTAALTAWATHLRVNSDGTSQFTETAFKNAPLTASELAKLGADCGFIQSGGSGHGLCSCSSE